MLEKPHNTAPWNKAQIGTGDGLRASHNPKLYLTLTEKPSEYRAEPSGFPHRRALVFTSCRRGFVYSAILFAATWEYTKALRHEGSTKVKNWPGSGRPYAVPAASARHRGGACRYCPRRFVPPSAWPRPPAWKKFRGQRQPKRGQLVPGWKKRVRSLHETTSLARSALLLASLGKRHGNAVGFAGSAVPRGPFRPSPARVQIHISAPNSSPLSRNIVRRHRMRSLGRHTNGPHGPAAPTESGTPRIDDSQTRPVF